MKTGNNVLLAMIAAGGMSTLDALARTRQLPPGRVVVGVIVMGLMLALISEAAPPVGRGFANIVILTSVLSGGAVWAAIADALD